MTKEYDLKEARRQFRFAKGGILLGGFSCTKQRFETERDLNANVVKYIEEAITQYKNIKKYKILFRMAGFIL